MKGNEKVIDAIQNVLTAELIAINQYFLHAEMYESWGLEKLSKQTKIDSIEEMKHAEKCMERMLYFEGMPNMTKDMRINVGGTVPEMLAHDLQLEYDAVAHLNKVISVAAEAGDNGTRDMFLLILKDEEDHVDFLETQLSLIEQIGLQNYLAAQA
ncbi:MAG: bacterioferritin [Ignavibacteriae bacterium]|nr:bacterioferritin [Ignavibacteriota bacterium]